MFEFFAAIKKKEVDKENFEKYRWFFTSSGKLVIGGKNAEQNENIMKNAERDDVVMHTSAPGSPFCIIKNPNKQDIEETAIFTACFSQEWKKKKTKAEVHIFRADQVSKNKSMKTGTFGVQGSIERKKAELKLALDFQKSKLRAVPLTAAKKVIAILTPGELDKLEATKKILDIIKSTYNYPITKEEVMSAIPADNMEVKEK